MRSGPRRHPALHTAALRSLQSSREHKMAASRRAVIFTTIHSSISTLIMMTSSVAYIINTPAHHREYRHRAAGGEGIGDERGKRGEQATKSDSYEPWQHRHLLRSLSAKNKGKCLTPRMCETRTPRTCSDTRFERLGDWAQGCQPEPYGARLSKGLKTRT